MDATTNLSAVYAPSKDVVTREIEGELIIIPLVSGIGDAENELFTLNDAGKAIWDRLDGKKTLKDVMKELSVEFEALGEELDGDVIELVTELLRRRIIVEISRV